MKSITIRGIDDRLHQELEKTSKNEHKSLNKTILFLLKKALNIEYTVKYPVYNDLDYLAGSWSKEDEEEFNNTAAWFNKVDEDIWK